MITTRLIAVAAAALALAACASNPPRIVKSQFEDIPVSKGMTYQSSESMAIETPTVQAAIDLAGGLHRGRLDGHGLARLVGHTFGHWNVLELALHDPRRIAGTRGQREGGGRDGDETSGNHTMILARRPVADQGKAVSGAG